MFGFFGFFFQNWSHFNVNVVCSLLMFLIKIGNLKINDLIGIIFKEKMISSTQQTCPTGEEPQEAAFACHDGLTCCRPHWPQPSAAPSPNMGDCQINTMSKTNHLNTQE